jgi:hypothetical protein
VLAVAPVDAAVERDDRPVTAWDRRRAGRVGTRARV